MAALAMGAQGSALVSACEEGRQYLVLGVPPVAKDQYGDTPFHAAAQGGFRDIVAMLLAKHEAYRDEQREWDGHTALQLASNLGHLSTVELLLEAGADPAIIPPKWQFSAYDDAAGNGRLDVMKAFRRFGAVASVGCAPAGTANSALHLACICN